jgi:hypothetical protein
LEFDLLEDGLAQSRVFRVDQYEAAVRDEDGRVSGNASRLRAEAAAAGHDVETVFDLFDLHGRRVLLPLNEGDGQRAGDDQDAQDYGSFHTGSFHAGSSHACCSHGSSTLWTALDRRARRGSLRSMAVIP